MCDVIISRMSSGEGWETAGEKRVAAGSTSNCWVTLVHRVDRVALWVSAQIRAEPLSEGAQPRRVERARVQP